MFVCFFALPLLHDLIDPGFNVNLEGEIYQHITGLSYLKLVLTTCSRAKVRQLIILKDENTYSMAKRCYIANTGMSYATNESRFKILINHNPQVSRSLKQTSIFFIYFWQKKNLCKTTKGI